MFESLSSPEIMIILLFLLIPIIVLIDIVRSEFTGNNKVVWVIGAILYLIIGRGQKRKSL